MKTTRYILKKYFWPVLCPFLRPIKDRKALQEYKRTGNHRHCHLMIDDGKKLMYVVNPKCACSSLKLSLVGKPINTQDYQNIHHEAQKNQYSINELNNEQQNYYKFTFVRNPFARVVSFYINKFEDRSSGYVDHAMDVRFSKVRSFDDLVNAIIATDMFYADVHFLPQSNILDSAPGEIDFIGRLENFNNDFGVLQKKFELPDITHQNKSPAYNYMDYYSLDILEKVADYYKEDIARYGYSDTYDEIKKYLITRS